MGVLTGAANLYFLYKFIRILTTPWEQSEAFKLGIVDENGKILIKKNKLKGSEQKEAYTMMHLFTWKIKRLLEKIPFGKSRLASYAAALWFIKEQNNFTDDSDEQLIQESLLSFLETDWEEDALILKENYEGDMGKKTFTNLQEGLRDLPPHLQKLVKKIEKRQKDWNKQNPTAKVKTLVYNPKTGKPDIEIEEKAPPGWEKTVKKMKKNKEIDNPYALAWYMANKGDKPEEWEKHTIGESMLSFSDFNESTKEYAKSLKKIANDRALKMLSKSERENLKKIADLLAKEKKEEYQKKPFAERIFESPVLQITDVDQWTMDIYKGIKAGWKSVAKSTLGGDKNVAILIKLTLEPEKEWPNKILHNATYGMIRIATDGTMEMFASDRKVKNMRKTRIRSAKDVVSKINAWIKKVDEDFIVPGVYLDEEVFQWYIIKGNTEKGKVAHVGTERQLKLQIRKPTFPDGHVLLKSRKHLKVGDKWKGSMGISEAVLADRDYKYDGKVVKISKKNFSKVHKDFKNSTKGKERMMINDPKTGGSISVPVKFEEVEIEEGHEPCPKCDGEGCEHCNGKGYHTEAKEREISHKEYLKYGAGKDGKQWTSGKGKSTRYWTHRKEEVELDEMPNRRNMEKINSLLKKHSGKFKWRDEVLYVEKGIEKDVNSTLDLHRHQIDHPTVKVSKNPMKEGFTTFTSYLNEGRPALDPDYVPGVTMTDRDRTKLVDSQQKRYTEKDIQGIARKHKVRLSKKDAPLKFGSEWTIVTMKGETLIYDERSNGTRLTGWKVNKDKLRAYKDRYEQEHTRMQDVLPMGGKIDLRGFESAFELIGEDVELSEEAPVNSVAGGGVNLDPFKKKKIRKNAKVKTEEFAGKKVFVVSPEKFWNARMGKSRYSRYEKYVGNDKLGEAIRQYGRENPKSPIILKNSENGAMLYLKYGGRI